MPCVVFCHDDIEFVTPLVDRVVELGTVEVAS
jgi:hypothetical protein